MPRMSARDELESVARRWIALWCAPGDRAAFDALHADDFVDEWDITAHTDPPV